MYRFESQTPLPANARIDIDSTPLPTASDLVTQWRFPLRYSQEFLEWTDRNDYTWRIPADDVESVHVSIGGDWSASGDYYFSGSDLDLILSHFEEQEVFDENIDDVQYGLFGIQEGSDE